MKKMMIFVALALALLVMVGCQTPVEQVDKTTTSPTDSYQKTPDTKITKTESMITEKVTEEVKSTTTEDDVDKEGSDESIESISDDDEIKSDEKAENDKEVTIISIGEKGFSPIEVTIDAGDTVRWVNDRSGRLSKALVLGNRQCIAARSEIMQPGESYEFTFTTPMRCTLTEGISTQQIGTIIVE